MRNPRIIPWKQDSKVFREGLRAEVFNEFRHQSAEGDWWFQLNVDEFYPESPKSFLARVPVRHDFVWGKMAEYVITERDMAFMDFSRPFEEIRSQLRYYLVWWSEPRAFRYRRRLVWNENWAWPRHCGLVAKERIIYKHYPCRSPKQLQVRWETRQRSRALGFVGWKENDEAFRQMVKASKDCLYDDGVSPLRFDEAVLPRHMENCPVRLLKSIMHRTGLWP